LARRPQPPDRPALRAIPTSIRKSSFIRRRSACHSQWPARSRHASHIQETTMTTKTEQIRVLNDRLRQDFSEGTPVLTCGIAALGAEAVARIVKTIAIFDDFCHANDPHQEHDFGAFEADGHAIFFKIDYYDKTLTHHSPDAADRSVTERVITIMLAEEY
jgi:hypothetical protein